MRTLQPHPYQPPTQYTCTLQPHPYHPPTQYTCTLHPHPYHPPTQYTCTLHPHHPLPNLNWHTKTGNSTIAPNSYLSISVSTWGRQLFSPFQLHPLTYQKLISQSHLPTGAPTFSSFGSTVPSILAVVDLLTDAPLCTPQAPLGPQQHWCCSGQPQPAAWV